MSELNLLQHMYSETREYDHHYSNVRTTLSTFFVGLGIAAGGLLYQNSSHILSVHQRFWLSLLIPLGLFLVAYFLSAWFQRATRVCKLVQIRIEERIAEIMPLVTASGSGNPTSSGSSSNITQDDWRKRYLFQSAHEKLLEAREATVLGSWRNGPQVILLVILLIHIGLWTVFVACPGNLGYCNYSSSMYPIIITHDKQEESLRLPLHFRWNPMEGVNLYKLTVSDETGVTICSSKLQNETDYTCQELSKNSAFNLKSVRAEVEMFAVDQAVPKMQFDIPVKPTEPLSQGTSNQAGSEKLSQDPAKGKSR